MSSQMAYLATDNSILWNSVGVGSHFGPNSEFIQSIHRSLEQVDTIPQTSTPVIQPTENIANILKEKSVQRFGLLIDKML